MKKSRRLALSLATLLFGASALVAFALPSNAAEQDLILALTEGTFTIGDSALDLPNDDPSGEGTAVFQAVYDDETGEVTGTFDIPTISTAVDNPVAPGTDLPVNITITQTAGGTGTIDPTTGVGTIDVTFSANFASPDPVIGPVIGDGCTLQPIEITLDVAADFSATPPTYELTADGFVAPAAAGCGDGGALDAVVNGAIGIQGASTTNTSTAMSFAQVDELPAPPTTTTTTTAPPAPPAPAPAAPAVQAEPDFTG